MGNYPESAPTYCVPLDKLASSSVKAMYNKCTPGNLGE